MEWEEGEGGKEEERTSDYDEKRGMGLIQSGAHMEVGVSGKSM